MSGSENDSEGPDDWEDWESEGASPSGTELAQSLFSSTVLPSIEAALLFDEQTFGFNFAAYRKQVGLDDYETIKCINFIRSEVAAGNSPLTALAVAASGGQKPWQDERFLQPVLLDDALLFHDYDDDAATDSAGPEDQAGPSRQSGSCDSLAALQQENAALRASLEALSAYVPDDVAKELFRRSAGIAGDVAEDMTGLELTEAPNTGNEAAAPLVVRNKQRQAGRLAEVASVDANYFDSYSSFNIHREMISDKVRTDAYQMALEGNPGLLGGAIVLDVGCGTGILSLFAARAGAARVIGIEGSDTMAGWARKVVTANGFNHEQGGIISIVAGRVEQLQSLPVDKVDLIVSEWMGYTLLFETMLDTVLYVRDRWLKPGGALLPDVASMFIAATGPGALDTVFWDSVYGFSMAHIGESIRQGCQGKAVVTAVNSQDLLTDVVRVQRFDLATMAAADADFHTDFQIRARTQEQAALHTVVLWFDVEFSARFCRQQPVVLSTSPYGPQTHWAQTVLALREPVELAGSGARGLKGRLSVARSHIHRSLDISLEYAPCTENGAFLADPVTSIYSIAMS